jgi:hypothetical protein
VLLLSTCAYATIMDPSIKGTDYWLRVVGRLVGEAFLPGVVTAVVLLFIGVLLGLKGVGISFGLSGIESVLLCGYPLLW